MAGVTPRVSPLAPGANYPKRDGGDVGVWLGWIVDEDTMRIRSSRLVPHVQQLGRDILGIRERECRVSREPYYLEQRTSAPSR